MLTPSSRPWGAPIAALALVVLGASLAVGADAPDLAYLVLDVCVGLSCAVVGALLLSRRPGLSIGRLFTFAGLGLALQAATGGWAVAAHRGGWRGEGFAFWVTNWVFLIGLGPLLLVPLFLPDGRLPSARWRPVAGTLVVLEAVLVVVLSLREEAWAWGIEIANPVGFVSTDRVVAPLFGAVIIACSATGATAMVLRLRRDETDRRQMYPLLGAALAVAVALTFDSLLPAHEQVGLWLVTLALTLLPVSVAFAVLRHRLFEVEVVVRRTLVYGVASALLLGAYVGVVALLDVPVLAAALVAVAFAPVRDLVQRALSRFLFGDRGDPATALSAFSRRLEDASETPLADAARTLAVTLRLPGAAVLDEAGRTISAYGAVQGATAVPLVASGRTEGTLLAQRRSPEEPLSPADLAVLGELARPLALAMSARRLDAEVRRSRELLVSAREEERRRLRRELHDGFGPSLAAIGMELDLALALSPAATDDVGRTATARARQLTGTLIADVRRIVHELRPAALDELGLVGALEDLALTPGAGPRITVTADPVPELPAAVEVAAFRIVQEAIANAVRHAGAHTVTVRLAVGPRVLAVEVADDGHGVRAGAREGVGTGSMRDRAAEVGGRFDRRSAPGGGTIVRAELPW